MAAAAATVAHCLRVPQLVQCNAFAHQFAYFGSLGLVYVCILLSIIRRTGTSSVHMDLFLTACHLCTYLHGHINRLHYSVIPYYMIWPYTAFYSNIIFKSKIVMANGITLRLIETTRRHTNPFKYTFPFFSCVDRIHTYFTIVHGVAVCVCVYACCFFLTFLCCPLLPFRLTQPFVWLSSVPLHPSRS